MSAAEAVEGTIDGVLDWVGDDPARAREAYLAEVEGKGRSTLLARLDAIANADDEPEAAAPEPEEDETEPEAAAPQVGPVKYRALKRMHAQGVVYEPGDLVPPAGTWTRVEGYVRAGWLEVVE